MTNLKEWMDAQWQAKGVKCANHGTAWLGNDVHSIHARAGTARNYKSKEQKAYEARFAIYNAKLAPVITAQEQVAPVPRKRVSRVKLAQAQEILSKVPQDELAAFLARFGLSMSLAASIASLDNIEMISRQFLRATL